MRRLFFATLLLAGALLLTRCSRKDCGCVTPPVNYGKLAYPDSIVYLKKDNYSLWPLRVPVGGGSFSAYPSNLTINRQTGEIIVTNKGTDGESQTGMWYKIFYRSANSDLVDSTMILISGISYVDKFYQLNLGDSIIYPIYNGDLANTLPSGNYDLKSDNKFAINAANGQININECKRRGFFSSNNTLPNTAWKRATIKYSINDKSQGADNQIDMVLYYYRTENDVPSNVSALMQAHRRMTLGLRGLTEIPATPGAIDNNLPSELSLDKPRPPCVIILGN